MPIEGRDIPLEITQARNMYRLHQRLWLNLHYIVGVLGILLGGLASQKPQWAICGVFAAASTAVVTFLGPQQRGTSYKHAEYRLSSAIIRFQNLPDTTMVWLLDEFQEAQKIVMTGDPKPQLKT